jgi:hypothetical protein
MGLGLATVERSFHAIAKQVQPFAAQEGADWRLE